MGPSHDRLPLPHVIYLLVVCDQMYSVAKMNQRNEKMWKQQKIVKQDNNTLAIKQS